MKKILLIQFLLFFFICAFAQDRRITGIVKNPDGKPLANVTVSLLSSNKSVLTGENGNFVIVVPAKGAVLAFSHVGFVRQEVKIGEKNTVDVVLELETVSLGDVVVVAYGTQRKKDVTVSIEKVNMGDLNKAPVRSFDEALGGRVAGVLVTSADGQPGAESRIVVRGNNSITQDNSPLYIIDGFPVENPNSNILNPQEIESIEILKDASATAIYGSRGANGVIMITTKKGKEGPAVINFSMSTGVQQAVKQIDMMSPYDFVKYQLERDTSSSPSSPKVLYLTNANKTLDDYKNEPAIDWQSMVLRKAVMRNYSLSVTGGSQNTKYLISGSVTDQDGIVINSNFSRYQGRVVLDQTINPKLKTGINATYTYIKQSGTNISQSNNSATTNVMYSVWGYRPVQLTGTNLIDLLFDPDVNSSNDYRINPYINLQNVVNDRFTKNLLVNAYAEYAILPELKLRITGGINSNTLRTEIFNNSKTQSGNPVTSTNGVNGSILYNEVNSWVNENILTYTKRIRKDHSLTLVGVASVQGGKNAFYGTSANMIPNESLGLSGLDEGVPQVITATSSNWKLASFAGRVNYNFKSRYYLTASYRADGSSRFAKGQRWGYFPSFSLAWRFSSEKFVKDLGIFSDAKLRFGYGTNGNNRIGDFAYLSTIGLPIGNAYTISNSVVRGAVPTAIGNPDLKWETTSETNLALDLGFFNNRISVTAEAYRKKTNDLLLLATLPNSTGYDYAYKNIGSVQNEGLEFTINTNNIKNKNFTWTSSFNIAFNRNKVLALTENQESLASAIRWDNIWQSVPGYIAKLNYPVGLMYGYIWDGVYQMSDFYKNTSGGYVLKDNIPTNGNVREKIQPGDIKYRDINGDGVVNSSDYTIIGNGVPKHTGGFSNNFTYKGFDLNIFFQWSWGNDILNTNKLAFVGNGLQKPNLNQYASYNDRWSEQNPNSDVFRTNGFFGGGYSSYLVEDGSYIRLKTVAIGYTLPEKFIKRFKIKSLRFNVAAQNLITWTNYTGVDPEVNTYNSALTPGFDWSAYPRAKTITIGANLTL